MEAFSLKGVWWLPENPDNEITGILTFDPRGNTELEMFGSIKEGFTRELKNQPIILGAGENTKAITLVNCIDLGTGIKVGQYQWRTPRYLPNLVIQGHHFERLEEIEFERLKVRYYAFSEWASTGKGWGDIDFDKPVPVQSTDDDIYSEIDGFTLIFRRSPSWSHQPFKEFSIREDALVDFVADSPWGYEKAISRIFQFGVFLSLAMKTSSWPISVKAPNPSSSRWELSIHYSPFTDYQESDRLSRSFIHFNLEDKIENIEQRLINWFAKSEILEQVFFLFNRAISKKMYLDDKFLTVAKAVEAYHRQMHEETYIDKSEFDKLKDVLKKEIKSCIPSDGYKDLRRRIYESLNLANYPSLHDRLDDLQKKHQVHNRKLFENFDAFADLVVNTRDQLTHYFDVDNSKARLDGPSLYYMSEKLRLILELCLLSELGFDDDELQQMMDKRDIPQDPEQSP